MNFPRFLRLTLLALPFAGLAYAQTDTPAPAPAPSAPAAPATCPVSGEELGSMGAPYIHTHKEEGKPDRAVALCCKMCVRKFNSDPAKYLAIVDAAPADAPAPEAAPPPKSSDHS